MVAGLFPFAQRRYKHTHLVKPLTAQSTPARGRLDTVWHEVLQEILKEGCEVLGKELSEHG